jgi:hypothetical protein
MQRRRPRRNHTPSFKAQVALAAIKGDRTLAQLAEQFDVLCVPKTSSVLIWRGNHITIRSDGCAAVSVSQSADLAAQAKKPA